VEINHRRSPLLTTAEAFEFCENMAKNHYENFPVGLLVDKRLRKHVYSIYAFARFADDIADNETIPIVERKTALNAWNYMLDRCYDGYFDHPIYIALYETIKEFNIPKNLLADLIKAFLMDLEKTRYSNFDEILFYCNHSANPVGRLILILAGKADDETFRLSDSICSGLQIANFLQDVSHDILKDRIYFPLDSFIVHGYSEKDFFDKINNEAFLKIFRLQAKRTQELFINGEKLIKHLSGRLKLEIILTLEGGKMILKKADKQKQNIFFKRPKINTFDKIILLTKSILKWILT